MEKPAETQTLTSRQPGNDRRSDVVQPGVSEGVWVLVAALALSTAFGGYRAARDGRFRGTHEVRLPTTAGAGDAGHPDDHGHAALADYDASSPAQPPNVLDDSGLNHDLGEKATLLQFSSAFCAPCRATRRILSDVADVVPGVLHIEVDAEQHLELVRRVGILRTPTTLVLDQNGAEISRATGAPRKEDVLTTLARALP